MATPEPPDLTQGNGQVRVGIIRRLSMRYGVHEDQRLVFCGSLPILLPMARPDLPPNE